MKRRHEEQLTLRLLNERLRKVEIDRGVSRELDAQVGKRIQDLELRLEVAEAALRDERTKEQEQHPFPEEPPVGSVVLDCDFYAWQRTPRGWWTISDPNVTDPVARDWRFVQEWHGPTLMAYCDVDARMVRFEERRDGRGA